MKQLLERLLTRALMPKLDRASRSTEWELNPLAKGRHRNRACPCGSGQKSKRCCGRYPALPENVAKAVRRALK